MLVTESLIVDEQAVLTRPRLPLRSLEGVRYTVLWTRGEAYAGVMWIAAGARVPEHVHADAAHHVWLAEGRARVDGERVLERAAYWYVPPGCAHSVEGLTPSGCMLFYLYLPEEVA